MALEPNRLWPRSAAFERIHHSGRRTPVCGGAWVIAVFERPLPTGPVKRNAGCRLIVEGSHTHRRRHYDDAITHRGKIINNN